MVRPDSITGLAGVSMAVLGGAVTLILVLLTGTWLPASIMAFLGSGAGLYLFAGSRGQEHFGVARGCYAPASLERTEEMNAQLEREKRAKRLQDAVDRARAGSLPPREGKNPPKGGTLVAPKPSGNTPPEPGAPGPLPTPSRGSAIRTPIRGSEPPPREGENPPSRGTVARGPHDKGRGWAGLTELNEMFKQSLDKYNADAEKLRAEMEEIRDECRLVEKESRRIKKPEGLKGQMLKYP